MTASEIARHFGAKRIGKGKWVARCTGHPDRSPSLAIAEGHTAVLVKCMSAGCDTRDILNNAGLRFSDLFYSSTRPAPINITMHSRMDTLYRNAGLALWLSALERPQYWRGAYRSIMREYDDLRHQLYIEEAPKK